MRLDLRTAAGVLGCGAEGLAEVEACGMAYDTRLLRAGDAFIGLKGEGVDGSRFVGAADAAGAAFFILNEAAKGTVEVPAGRVLYVKDTYEAFFALARWWRGQLAMPFVGVTGSAGKTTVRDMVAHILGAVGEGAVSSKNYNNHIGVPYTLCRIEKDARWAVVEMGMNHAGEIRQLSRLARPGVGVITSIGPAHIEFLGSLENIAKAKLEIVEGIEEDGTLVVPLECEVLHRVMREQGVMGRKVATFGVGEGADCRVSAYRQKGLDGILFRMALDGEEGEVCLGVLGEHNMLNAAAAALACKRLMPDLAVEEIAVRLMSFRAPEMRLNVKTLANGKRVIDDAYNANPASMRAAMAIVAALKKDGLRVGVVLGDMFELGEHAAGYHAELAREVVAARPDFVVAVGAESAVVAEGCRGAGIEALWAADSGEAGILEFMAARGWDVVLVKGSRGMKLEVVTAGILGEVVAGH